MKKTVVLLLGLLLVALTIGCNPPPDNPCDSQTTVYQSAGFKIADELIKNNILSSSFTSGTSSTLCTIKVLLKGCGRCKTTGSQSCSTNADCIPPACPTCSANGEVCLAKDNQTLTMTVQDQAQAPNTTYCTATRSGVSPVGWYTFTLATSERFPVVAGQRYYLNLSTFNDGCSWTRGDPTNANEHAYINGTAIDGEFEFVVNQDN